MWICTGLEEKKEDGYARDRKNGKKQIVRYAWD